MSFFSENSTLLIFAVSAAIVGGSVFYNLFERWLFRSMLTIFASMMIAASYFGMIGSPWNDADFDDLIHHAEDDIENHRIHDYMTLEGIDIKSTANISDLKLPMYIIIPSVAAIYKSIAGEAYTPTITSGNDSDHGSNSMHYDDLALDWRTKDLPQYQSRRIYKRLKSYLGDNYTVILEDLGTSNEHIHIEYDGMRSKKDMYRHLITYESARNKVNPALILSIVNAESSFDQDAVSNAGAIGLMQLMPSTAKDLGVNPNKAHDNIKGGIKYMKYLVGRYNGNVELALMSYHCGMAHVDSALSISKSRNWKVVLGNMKISDKNKKITRFYVDKIMKTVKSQG